jgi:hypothetical protein
MTEDEWIACKDYDALLKTVLASDDPGEAVRLWSCRCVRRVWHLLADQRSRDAVDVAERLALSEAGREELDTAFRRAHTAWVERSQSADDHAAAAAFYCASPSIWRVPAAVNRAQTAADWGPTERAELADLLRSTVEYPLKKSS